MLKLRAFNSVTKRWRWITAPSEDSETSIVKSADSVLNHSEILALPTTAFELVAGVPDVTIIPILAYIRINTVGYGNFNNPIKFGVTHDPTFDNPSFLTFISDDDGSISTFFNGSYPQPQTLICGPPSWSNGSPGKVFGFVPGNFSGAAQDLDGLPVVLAINNDGDNLTLGDEDDTMKIKLLYITIP